MTSAVVKIDFDNNFEVLVEGVAKLNSLQLKILFDKVNNRIVEKKDLTPQQQEAYLLKQIKEKIPATLIQRYKKLYLKSQNGTINNNEHLEILQITNFIELRSAERIPLLEELAELKKMPLLDLIKQLNLKNFNG